MQVIAIADTHVRAVAFDCYGTLVRIADRRRPFERLARAMGVRQTPARNRCVVSGRCAATEIRKCTCVGHREELADRRFGGDWRSGDATASEIAPWSSEVFAGR